MPGSEAPSNQSIIQTRGKEEARKTLYWFTEDEYPEFLVYTGKQGTSSHKHWKHSVNIKTWSEWVDEFFDYMSNYE